MNEAAFPHPETIGDPDDGTDLTGDEQESEQPSAEDRLADMERRLEEERQRAEDDRQRYQQSIQQLMAQPRHTQSEPEQPDITLDDLPDPVENPKDYHQALQQRIQDGLRKTAERTTQQTTTQYEQQQRVQRVWDEFKGEYPELAKREAHLTGAAQMEAQAMRASGLDPLGDPATFKRRVAERMEQELGEASPAGGKTPGRTKGVTGGTRTASGGGDKTAKKPPGFLDQLKKSQLESGLI